MKDKKENNNNKELLLSGDLPVNGQELQKEMESSHREGGSFLLWLLYLKKWWKPALISFLILFSAGSLWTFLSPKYYKAEAAFFFPLSSPGGGLLNTLGLSGIIDTPQSMGGYAVSILQSAGVSNNVIDKFGDRLFEGEKDTPRFILLKKLKKIVKINLTESQVVQIAVETKDPVLSAETANFYMEEYRRYSQESNLFLASSHRENMEKQREIVRKELQDLENKLLAFQHSEKVVDPPAELQSMMQYYTNIKAAKVMSQVSLDQSQARLDALRRKLTQQAESSADNPDYSQMLGNPAISSLYQQIVLKEAELAKNLQSKTEENPAVIGLQNEISDMRELLSQRIRGHLAGVESELTSPLIEAYAETLSTDAKTQALERIVEDLEKKFQDIPELAHSYRQLHRDVLIKEKLLGYLEMEVEKARSDEFKNPSEIQILDRAVPPDMYSRPILRWYLLGVLILSFIGSLLVVKTADLYQKFKLAATNEEV